MITRSTLRSQIATALRDEVLAGRLPPGRHFTVREIADQYGVSATPVREALADLAAQGLLDVEQHRGFRVHEFTLDDFREMIDARTLVIEGVFRRVVAQAASHPTASRPTAADPTAPRPGTLPLWPGAGREALDSVRRRAEAAQRAALAGELDILIGYDLRFWRELGALVGNACITDFLDRMRIQCWAFGVPYLRREHDLRGRLWAGHCGLVEAVERQEPEVAGRIVAEYNEHWLALIEKLAR